MYHPGFTNHTPNNRCDPPVSLLEGTMEVMRAMDPGARYVFYTGDMPAHHLCTGALCSYMYNVYVCL